MILKQFDYEDKQIGDAIAVAHDVSPSRGKFVIDRDNSGRLCYFVIDPEAEIYEEDVVQQLNEDIHNFCDGFKRHGDTDIAIEYVFDKNGAFKTNAYDGVTVDIEMPVTDLEKCIVC